jgi:hypothetical protein
MTLQWPSRDAIVRWLRRTDAKFRRVGYCYQCNRGWHRSDGHITWFGPSGGCFPLCDDCWVRLEPDERLPYYESHIARYGICIETADAIRQAVRAGF